VRLPGFLRRSWRAEKGVAVVGSGLPAVATALEIVRRGKPVVVLGSAGAEERPRGLGLVLLGTGRPYALVAREIGRSAAQLVWAAGCENHLRLRALLEKTQRDCGYQAQGSFLLGASRAEAEELALSEDMLRDDGFPGEFLDHYMLETRFDVTGFPGAYWAAEDAGLDSALLLNALAELARVSGVAFEPVPVRGLVAETSGMVAVTEDGLVRASAAVVATDGAASGLVPEIRPLLRPAAQLRLRARLPSGAALPGAGRTADGRQAWKVVEDSIVLAETGAREGSAPEAAAALSDLAARFHVETADARRWEEEGELPVDGRPVVGRLEDRPLAVACGFGALVPSFAFAAARWVADALLSDLDPTPEPLRPSRAKPLQRSV
jgi:glycine/D-amino acid oxidase-like deaminating enzyme